MSPKRAGENLGHNLSFLAEETETQRGAGTGSRQPSKAAPEMERVYILLES